MGSKCQNSFFLRTFSCCISNLRESQMQQHGRKYFGQEPHPTPSNPGGQKVKIKFLQNIITFRDMAANILPTYLKGQNSTY